jgi:crotonobetainyl-CoA:carnitine CoA-transferase CaiB-like acyl-CoA transferase
VAVSMTGFGEDGPERDRMAYGSIIDALSGVASSNGRPGGGPTDFPMSLPDPCAGFHAAIATLAALRRARRTGRGERVECAMLEASVAAFPWPVLYQGVEGRPPPVIGNRDERFAPHDVYRCRGEYEWVAIAVTDDGAFGRLVEAIGHPTLAADPRFATAADRRAHADALDVVLTTWTASRTPAEAASTLRAAGVLAEPVAHMPDVAASPVLGARHFFTHHPHPAVGVKPLPGAAWSTDRSPMVVGRAAPCLGADTRAVLQEWLGLPEDEIERLAQAGVIPAGDEPEPAG